MHVVKTTSPQTLRWRSPLAILTALLVAFGSLVAMPVAAQAAPVTVTGANLQWGFKDSWRGYIGNPGNATGGTTFGGGASDTPSPYNWGTVTTGTYDSATKQGAFTSPGSVQWTYPTHGIDITFSNLTTSFDLNAGTGTITGDYASQSGNGTGEVLANFTTAGATDNGAGVVSLAGGASTASAAIEAVSTGFYKEGDALDPVNFTLNYQVPAAATTTTLSASATTVDAGGSVDLTATVSPSGAVGTVNFFEGATQVGSAAVAAGSATATLTQLEAGTHNYTATFEPTDPAAFVTSSSSAVTVTVNTPATAAATTTTWSGPGAGAVLLGEQVTLSATVGATVGGQPVVPEGDVEFFSISRADASNTDRVSLGRGTVDPGTGVASFQTADLAAGGYSFVAVFRPADQSAFATSEGEAPASGGMRPSPFHFSVVDTDAPEPYEPGAGAQSVADNASATWDWSVYSAGWTKTGTGDAATTSGTSFTLTNGDVTADAGGVKIQFTGTLTNSAYGGMVTLSIGDPALHIAADGTGVWTATVNGGSDRVVVGTFSNAGVTVGGQNDLSGANAIALDYAGATAQGTWSAGSAGAWPNGYIMALDPATRAFFYDSGSSSDGTKPASPLNATFDWPQVSETSVAADGPVVLGEDAEITATVSPANATGTVEFFETPAAGPNANTEVSLGTATVAAGEAVLTTDELVAGGHAIRVEFTGTNGWPDSAGELQGSRGAAGNLGVVDPSEGQGTTCTPSTESEQLTGVSANWDWNAYSSGWTKVAGGNVSLDGDTFTLSDGVATVDANCTRIAFTGTLRVEAYAGFFPPNGQWVELVDPVLTVAADGTGNWSAKVRSGVAALNQTTSERVVVAAVTGAGLDFTRNVVNNASATLAMSTVSTGTWSLDKDQAWSNAFILQVPSAIRSFFYASGASGDVNKPPAPVAVNWALPDGTLTANDKGSNQTFLRGQEVNFVAKPFRLGDEVEVTIDGKSIEASMSSAPMQTLTGDPADSVASAAAELGPQTIGADGVARAAWTVPSDFATGAHTVTFDNNDGRAIELKFSVAAKATKTTDTSNVCVARSVTGGSMNWGIKQSFKSYVTGPVAKGTFSGGSFSATGGAINVEDGNIGRVNFSGSIQATGHGGILNLSLNNPSVQITGANSGILYGTFNGSNVAVATLGFSSVSVTGDTLTATGSRATLTGAASAAFEGYYGAGESLDPVSFTASLGGEVACDSTTSPEAVAELAKSGGDDTAWFGMIAGLVALLGAAGIGLARARQRGFAVRR